MWMICPFWEHFAADFPTFAAANLDAACCAWYNQLLAALSIAECART